MVVHGSASDLEQQAGDSMHVIFSLQLSQIRIRKTASSLQHSTCLRCV